MASVVSPPQDQDRVTLFADVSGSVGLYAARGDSDAFQLVTAAMDLMAEQVIAHGGRVVRQAGDGVLAVFDESDPAVQAAVAMQEKLERGTLGDEGVRMRVGVSRGRVIDDGKDIYGDSVNVAARLVGVAGPGEILVSEGAFRNASLATQRDLESLSDLAVRGRPSAVPIYRYRSVEPDSTVLLSARGGGSAARLRLSWNGVETTVSARQPKVRLGRSNDNDIVVSSPHVSRHHAEVSLRGDKFVLTDRSVNGCIVIVEDGSRVTVRREDMILLGRGSIILGDDAVNTIPYERLTG